jgi:hypothetical protein
MLFKGIIPAYFLIHMQHVSTLSGENTEFLNFKVDGEYVATDHCEYHVA